MLTIGGIVFVVAFVLWFNGAFDALSRTNADIREGKEIAKRSGEKRVRQDKEILGGDWSGFEYHLRKDDRAISEWEIDFYKKQYLESLRKRKTLWRRFLYGERA